MRIPYYPGCTLKTKAKNFEDSAVASAKVLDIELVELLRWNCCGAVYSLTSDDLIHHLAPIRNLIRVQEMNKDKLVENESRIMTLCSMCYNVLKRTNLRMKENQEDLEKINNFMDLEEDYDGTVEIIHFLELLQNIGFDKIKKKVKKPLKNIKVAPYYGCMLLRPKEAGIDDPEDPQIQEKLFECLGAEVASFPYKTMCCGSYQTVHNKSAVVDLVYKIITQAQSYGAEVITTSCPLCAFNLDTRQREIKERYPEFENIPVLYFTQLMAMAFGLDLEFCRFDLNYINPKPFFERIGYL